MPTTLSPHISPNEAILSSELESYLGYESNSKVQTRRDRKVLAMYSRGIVIFQPPLTIFTDICVGAEIAPFIIFVYANF